MAETTPRLSLPLLEAGQAQKELYHNEALALLDMAASTTVEAVGLDTPPAAPVPGQCWIVGASPVGDWNGRAHAIAGWTANGWRFVAPRPGMAAWSLIDGVETRYDGAAWRLGEMTAVRVVIGGLAVLGPRAGAITAPAGGAVVDTEARAAISAILATLQGHGLLAG